MYSFIPSCCRRFELGARPRQVGGLHGGVLLVVVVDGRLDRVLSKHTAVELDRRQTLETC